MLPWLDGGSAADQADSDKKDKDKDGADSSGSTIVDDSWLYGGDDAIDTGVTSGADPSAWDPIGIEHKPDK